MNKIKLQTIKMKINLLSASETDYLFSIFSYFSNKSAILNAIELFRLCKQLKIYPVLLLLRALLIASVTFPLFFVYFLDDYQLRPAQKDHPQDARLLEGVWDQEEAAFGVSFHV